jgi:hypothetical protein
MWRVVLSVGVCADIGQFLGLFDTDLELPSDAGINTFQSRLEDIVTNLLSQSTQDDVEPATVALSTLLDDVSSRSIFDTRTIADLIDAVKALAILSLDILQDLVNAILELFKFMALSIVQVFSTPVDIVGIRSLSEYLMDKDCTVAGMCSLAVAVPFTIIYKLITGQAPFEDVTPEHGTALPLPDPTLHLIMGVLGILKTMWNVMDDLTGAKLMYVSCVLLKVMQCLGVHSR